MKIIITIIIINLIGMNHNAELNNQQKFFGEIKQSGIAAVDKLVVDS